MGVCASAQNKIDSRKFKDGSIDKAEFLNRLKYMKGVTYQFYFGTEEAIKHLIKL